MESHCKSCGSEVDGDIPKCPNCGAIQDTFTYKSRIAAATLAIFGGIFGAHRFFLGQWWGIFYLLFFWTYIPWIVGLVEGIVFLATSQDNWNKKYNQGISAGTEKGTVVIVLAVILPAIAVMGIIAAIAIPAYQDYTIRAKLADAHILSDSVMEAVEVYAIREREWPESIDSVGINQHPESPHVSSIEIDQGVVYINISPESGSTGTIIYVPTSTESGITWSCKESTVPAKYLPPKCRP